LVGGAWALTDSILTFMVTSAGSKVCRVEILLGLFLLSVCCVIHQVTGRMDSARASQKFSAVTMKLEFPEANRRFVIVDVSRLATVRTWCT